MIFERVTKTKSSVLPDIILLASIWILVFVTSLTGTGKAGAAVFVVLNIIAVLRRPLNGLLVLCILLQLPTAPLAVPRPFAVSTTIAWIGVLFAKLPVLSCTANRVAISIAMFVWYTTLSTVVRINISRDFERIIPLWEGLLFVLLTMTVIRTQKQFATIIKWIVVLAACSLPVSAIHHIKGRSTEQYRVVAYSRKTALALERKFLLEAGGQSVRWIWYGADPNYRGMLLVFPLVMSFTLFACSGSQQERLLWSITTAGCALSVLGTFSRSAFLCSALGILGFAILSRARGLIAIALFSTSLIVALLVFPMFADRISTIVPNIREKGGTGRFHAWQKSIEIWSENPVFGNGGVTTKQLGGYATHNSFFQVLADYGLVGFVLYSFPVASCIAVLRKRHSRPVLRHDQDFMANGLACGVLSSIAMASTITLFEPMTFWFVLTLGFIFGAVQRHVRRCRNGTTNYLRSRQPA